MHTLLAVVFSLAPSSPDGELMIPPARPLVAVLPPGPGDLVQKHAVVLMPLRTPYLFGSRAEAKYLKGYAEGHADAVRGHFICRSRVGDRVGQPWSDGWVAGYEAASRKPGGKAP